jgi:hypothetical protein
VSRGKILALTNRDVVKRAMSMVGFKVSVDKDDDGDPDFHLPGQYCMEGGRNGGDDPTRPHPFSVWYYEKGKRTVATADCVGFGMWCQGADRKLSGRIHDYDGGWVNTDSACLDSDGDQELFERVAEPFPGCIVVYPSYRLNRRRVPGHWGTVVSVIPAKGREKALVQAAHCHGPPLKGPAISIGDASAWLKHAGGRYLRFKVSRTVRS